MGWFEFDEDALAWTIERGIDHTLLRTLIHRCEAVGTARIIERPAVLCDIRNTVLQLHEDVGTVVDAQAITGAEVLINPHPHGVRR